MQQSVLLNKLMFNVTTSLTNNFTHTESQTKSENIYQDHVPPEIMDKNMSTFASKDPPQSPRTVRAIRDSINALLLKEMELLSPLDCLSTRGITPWYDSNAEYADDQRQQIETNPRALDDVIIAPGVVLIREESILLLCPDGASFGLLSDPPPDYNLGPSPPTIPEQLNHAPPETTVSFNSIAAALSSIRATLPPGNRDMTPTEDRHRALIFDGCNDLLLPSENLGIAAIEPNDGFWDGPNNCLLVSLRDFLIPKPQAMRDLLAECFLEIDADLKLSWARAILADMKLEILERFEPDVLDAHCFESITGTGDLYAPLLIRLLEQMDQLGKLGSILLSPVTIVFFQEKAKSSFASFSTSVFASQNCQSREVAMVCCSSDGTHFQRLRPIGAIPNALPALSPSLNDRPMTLQIGSRPTMTPTLESGDSLDHSASSGERRRAAASGGTVSTIPPNQPPSSRPAKLAFHPVGCVPHLEQAIQQHAPVPQVRDAPPPQLSQP